MTLKVLKEELGKEREENFLVDAYWTIYRFFVNDVAGFPRNVKWFIQRGRRGWADGDSWSIDSHLSKIIPEMIDRLKDNDHGIPMAFLGESSMKEDGIWVWSVSDEEASANWNKALDKIADGFRATEKFKEYVYKNKEDYDAKEAECDKRFREGMALFTEHFGSLWD